MPDNMDPGGREAGQRAHQHRQQQLQAHHRRMDEAAEAASVTLTSLVAAWNMGRLDPHRIMRPARAAVDRVSDGAAAGYAARLHARLAGLTLLRDAGRMAAAWYLARGVEELAAAGRGTHDAHNAAAGWAAACLALRPPIVAWHSGPVLRAAVGALTGYSFHLLLGPLLPRHNRARQGAPGAEAGPGAPPDLLARARAAQAAQLDALVEWALQHRPSGGPAGPWGGEEEAERRRQRQLQEMQRGLSRGAAELPPAAAAAPAAKAESRPRHAVRAGGEDA